MSEELKQRAEFENALGNGYDYTKEPDAWARPRYKQTHIEAMFNGWQLARRTPDTSAKVDVEAVATAISKHMDACNLWEDLRSCEPAVLGGICAGLARAALAALQAPRSDTSAVELVRALISDLRTNRITFSAMSMYCDVCNTRTPSGSQEQHRDNCLFTKVEQWLKKQGA